MRMDGWKYILQTVSTVCNVHLGQCFSLVRGGGISFPRGGTLNHPQSLDGGSAQTNHILYLPLAFYFA